MCYNFHPSPRCSPISLLPLKVAVVSLAWCPGTNAACWTLRGTLNETVSAFIRVLPLYVLTYLPSFFFFYLLLHITGYIYNSPTIFVLLHTGGWRYLRLRAEICFKTFLPFRAF
ncbi:hypothetical protein CEXT_475711 [Caerostris extrusa]|uniref:Uncharacterized protein n=1 Tax=Caerostris extrusa TaxID=172846 RepID=A0AAV4N8W0_CAEEX|nr:hypothetical protein CEXT_475711 [Caerostris extrusa]